MKQTSLGLLGALLIPAGALLACGAEPPTGIPAFGGDRSETNAVPNTGSPENTGSPILMGGAGATNQESNPALTLTPTGSAGSAANPPDTSGSGDTTNPTDTSNPIDTTNPVIPGASEPTDCGIPAPAANTPIGYGAATTGGGTAPPVEVSSFAEAQAALDAYRDAFKDGAQNALVLRYTGSFDYATINDVCVQHTLDAQILEIKQMDNVTFVGAPGSSGNFGIHINRAHNVIVRNMTLGLLPGGDSSDAITVEGNGTNGDVENVWIDHNELFSSTKDDCDGAGDTEFDGLIDIKKGARRITISYNYLHDHQKTGLIGFSDSDDTERYVTFHHNRYENVVSRTPLQRFGLIHVFNNYYGRITGSGINVRMGGIALIESNFFENAANPITSRFSDVAGFWELRNNHVGPGITWTTESDTLANADSWQNTATFPAGELNYAYTPDRAGCVKQIVLAQAGAKL